MSKLIVYLKPKFEEYDVEIYMYNQEGKLVDQKSLNHIKQVVIKSSEVRISRQLFHDYVALIVEAQKPRVDVREEGVVYIVSE